MPKKVSDTGRVGKSRAHAGETKRPVRVERRGEALAQHGIYGAKQVHWNLRTAALYEEALRRHEGQLSTGGPLIVRTGQHTGRSPNDKFIVREPSSEQHIWWGDANRPLSEEHFDRLHQRVLAYLKGKHLFVQDCFVGANPAYQHPVRVITETAWHSLFARTIFRSGDQIQNPPGVFEPGFTVLHAPNFQADPATEGTNSGAFILMHFGKKIVLIGGTSYAGEIKKSVFTIMNYLLPLEHVLSMHCSANIGPQGDTAIFFGLSGTGKTSLSADPSRTLIGDDEHGWSAHGVFNFEGGCYAKMIRLSPTAEPDIYATTRRFGTVLENVAMDPATHHLDLDDDSLTENTRGAYPLHFISNASADGIGGHPKNIIMLTCDAFGVLPPLAKLTPEQAMYHFLSGYTAKVAGTEKGITEPKATFSACFGAPFMALHPSVYAKLLGEQMVKHKAACWLVNTGWSGGPYGVGSRIKITYTRAMVAAALSGSLADAPTKTDPIFGMETVTKCPEVPDKLLDPRGTWKDQAAFHRKANALAEQFHKNFAQFADQVSADVRQAAPRPESVGSSAT